MMCRLQPVRFSRQRTLTISPGHLRRVACTALLLVAWATTLLSPIAYGQEWQSNGNDLYYDEGKVGIGTMSPDYRLDIGGSLSGGFGIGNGGDSGRIWTRYEDYSPNLIFYDYDDRGGIIRFRESPNTDDEDDPEHEVMIVGWRGNIGINTLKPSERLAVDGKVKAKEVIVTETGWSDFVFEEGYEMPTLAEVKAHIEERGHLPGIPSAEEVERDGVRLGQMDAKLLQKIEELTLYVIEQQEQNRALQKQVAVQQRQFAAQQEQIDRLGSMIEAMRDERR